MSDVRYQIRNSTVKPKKLDRRTGRDARSTVEKRGHPVQWRDAKGNTLSVNPGGHARFVSEVPEGLLRLARGGLVDIREIKGGVTAQMREHTLGARTAQTTEVKINAAEEAAARVNAEGDIRPTPVEMETPEAPGDTQPEIIPPSNQAAVTDAASAAPEKKVSAVVMGQDDHGEGKEGDSTGYPGAVNPDGPDKHTVVAGKTSKKTSKKKTGNRRSRK